MVVLLEDQADQVASAGAVVVAEVVVHPFHWLSEATAAAEAAPTMAAVAMTDFILIVGVGTRKSDCGQVLVCWCVKRMTMSLRLEERKDTLSRSRGRLLIQRHANSPERASCRARWAIWRIWSASRNWWRCLAGTLWMVRQNELSGNSN